MLLFKQCWGLQPTDQDLETNFGMALIEDKLSFVIWDFIGILTISSVEYYDVLADRWSQACQMGTARIGLSFCVVSELPNLEKYMSLVGTIFDD